MSEIIYKVGMALVAFIAVIGPAIFLHELGHFLLAKRHGIRVFTFSLGFGPRLWSRTYNGTEYCLCLIPLGGYVKMAGEDPADERTGSRDEFAAKSVYQRATVILAGPLMNLISGFLICVFIYLVGVETVGFLPRIGYVAPEAAAHGLEVGDVIAAVNGRPVSSWQEFERVERVSRDREVLLEIVRGEERMNLAVTPTAMRLPNDLTRLERLELGIDARLVGNGSLGIGPWVDPVIGEIREGAPAVISGLQKGDRILAINDTPVRQWQEIAILTRAAGDEPLRIRYQRDGVELMTTVAPKMTYTQRPDGSVAGFAAIGITAPTVAVPRPLLQSISSGFFMSIRMGRLIWMTLKKLFTGQLSFRLLSGPVGIAQGSGAQLREGGVMQLVYFLALISVNLGLVNLLPLPLLDGGWLFIFLLYEAIARKPMPQKVQERLMQAGLAMLLVLIVAITWNDLGRILGFRGTSIEEVMEASGKQ